MTNTTQAEARALSDQADQRLLWAGAAANGALILAYISFAGNSDDVRETLRFVSIPLIFALTGFSFGGTAISWAIARVAYRQAEGVAYAQLQSANTSMAAFQEVFSAPSVDPTVAALIWGDGADDEVRRLIFERLQVAKARTDEAPAAAKEALRKLEDASNAGLATVTRARRWLWASFATGALSVAWLVGAAWDSPAEQVRAPSHREGSNVPAGIAPLPAVPTPAARRSAVASPEQ